ncbi:MAG: NUDIX domain-containing protein [Anaerolineae bacterium]|nr:NUDIX domain-containing protein [Anaerolineae bacterium]
MSQQFVSRADGYVKWLRERVGPRLIYLVYATNLVFDEAGRILVQRRYDFDWLGVPGGALELGESIRACAVRETLEETGLRVEVERLVGVFSHPDYNLRYPNGDYVQQWTACVVSRPIGGQIRADGSETLAVSWLAVDEALPLFPPAYRAMVRAALESPGEAVLEPIYAEPVLTPYYPLLRAAIGHAPVILPGAMGLVPNERGDLLCTQRTDDGLWHPPSGYADLGETTTATVVREVREETGLIVEPTRVVGLYSETPLMLARFPNGDLAHNLGLAIECRVAGGALHADGLEASAVAFKPIEELLAQPFADQSDTPQILRDYLHHEMWPVLR